MKRFTSLSLIVLAAPAVAHPGHLAEQAGHSHWLAPAAIIAAIVVAIAGLGRAFSRRRSRTVHE